MREGIVSYMKWAIGGFPCEEPILDAWAGCELNYYEPFFPGKRYIKLDIRDFDPPCIDIQCDVCDMKPISDESIGLVLCLESLEHIPYPKKAIEEIRRVLRPDALLILTTVTNFRIHRCPKDHWRFAPDGIELLLGKFKILDCTLEGGLKRPKRIWMTAQETALSKEWRKLPPLNTIESDSQIIKKLGWKFARLKGVLLTEFN
jgi:SAM-dependent methyltransferase